MVVGVVILLSVGPVCQLFFFGIILLCGVTVHMLHWLHFVASYLMYFQSKTALGL